MNRYSTRLPVVAACLAALLSVSALATSEPLKAIIGSYLEIHAKLSNDKNDGIKAPAEAIVKQAQALGPAGQKIAKAAAAVGAAGDLKSARDAFGGLSDAVIVLDKGRIVQTGTHRELVATPGLYQKLHRLQFRLADQLVAQNRAG